MTPEQLQAALAAHAASGLPVPPPIPAYGDDPWGAPLAAAQPMPVMQPPAPLTNSPSPTVPSVGVKSPPIDNPIGSFTQGGDASVGYGGLSPNQLAIEQQRASVGDKTVGAINKQTDVNVTKAGIEADRAGEEQRFALESAQRMAEARAAADKAYQVAQKDHERAYADYRKADFKNFWADKSTGDKVAAQLYAGLLGIASTGPNAIDRIVDHDFEIQKARMERQKDLVVMARTGMTDAAAAREKLLSDLMIREAAAREQIGLRAKVRAAALGTAEARAAGDKLALEQEEKSLALRAKAFEPETRKYEQKKTESGKVEDARMVPGVGATAPIPIYGPNGQPIGTVPATSKADVAALGKDIAFADKIQRAAEKLARHKETVGVTAGPLTEAGRERGRLQAELQGLLAKPPTGSARWTKEYIENLRERAGIGPLSRVTGIGAEEARMLGESVAADVESDKGVAGFQSNGAEAQPAKPAKPHGKSAHPATAAAGARKVGDTKTFTSGPYAGKTGTWTGSGYWVE